MGPKLMSCCKPKQGGTNEHGKMLKQIQVLEDGRVLAKESRNWNIEGQKRRIARKEYKRLFYEFEMMAQKGLWDFAREKCYRTEEHCLRQKVTLSESIRRCMKRIS